MEQYILLLLLLFGTEFLKLCKEVPTTSIYSSFQVIGYSLRKQVTVKTVLSNII